MKSSIYDTKKTIMGQHLSSLYFYLIPRSEIDNDDITEAIGYVSNKIMNICFNPFLEKYNVSSTMVNVDLSSYDYRGYVTYPHIYRVLNIGFKDFNLNKISIDYSSYSSTDESKHLCYPFRYFLLTDYVNPPIILKPQYLNGEITINVKCGVSNTSKYSIYCKNYKGDINGNLEAIVNNNAFLYPVVSDSYQEFIGSSGNSFINNKNFSLLENNLNYKQSTRNNAFNVLGEIGNLTTSAAMQNPFGAISSVMNLFGSGLSQLSITENKNLKEFEIEKSHLSTIQDKINTPNSIKSAGNDAIFNIENAKNKIDIIEYGLRENREDKIKKYFKKYGVKTMNYDVPNIKSRKYYNFLKTVNCNIDNAKIPFNDLKKIENIINSGITFWHIDNGATVKNYNVNNEVV